MTKDTTTSLATGSGSNPRPVAITRTVVMPASTWRAAIAGELVADAGLTESDAEAMSRRIVRDLVRRAGEPEAKR